MRAQTEFVSKVTHELRTPLTSMTYAARNLLKGVAGPPSSGKTSVIRGLVPGLAPASAVGYLKADVVAKIGG